MGVFEFLMRVFASKKEPEEKKKFSPLLEFEGDGKVVTYFISGRCGAGLLGRPLGSNMTVEIKHINEAIDPTEFRAMWQRFLGDAKVRWE